MKKFKDLDCVLLVDDDHLANFIHRKAVQKSQVDVHIQTTESAEEALEFLTHAARFETSADVPRPGIIFLDINMPGMTGWDFMEEYSKLSNDQKARIVVIMLTTSLNPDDERKAIANNDVIRFINKPLRAEMVEEIASQYFEELTLQH
jgi:CheY-like chemotaxis protein